MDEYLRRAQERKERYELFYGISRGDHVNCLACGATVYQTYTITHMDWHDRLTEVIGVH